MIEHCPFNLLLSVLVATATAAAAEWYEGKERRDGDFHRLTFLLPLLPLLSPVPHCLSVCPAIYEAI